ncbi:MAG: GlxA family transcriptional regulator [Pseudomonadota bacterium]
MRDIQERGRQGQSSPTRFGFILIPGFSLLSFSCAVDVLRAACLEAPNAGFSWELLSPHGASSDAPPSIASSSGISLAVTQPHDMSNFDALIVCGGVRSHAFLQQFSRGELGVKLRAAAMAQRMVGSLSDGAYLVAATGLFDKCRSTIHWKCQSAYREMHPALDVRASLLEIDGNRVSCAGGTASLDLTLHLVARTIGWSAAGRIADNYIHDQMRSDEEMTFASEGFRFVGKATGLGEILTDMEAHIETPLSITELARRHSISPRQLDRLFRRHLGKAPTQHYRKLRLVRAAGLLRQSDLSIAEIAVACGFNSSSHLARTFREEFGKAPLAYRRSVMAELI